MAIKDTDRKARANYKKKITTVRVELYGTDEDIREHLETIKEAGGSVQGYLKDLIREDMKQTAPEPEAAVYTRKSFWEQLKDLRAFVESQPEPNRTWGLAVVERMERIRDKQLEYTKKALVTARKKKRDE